MPTPDWTETAWTNSGPQSFCIEASDLPGMRGPGHDPILCPKCNKALSPSSLRAHKDAEGELTHWTMTHNCNAKLTIFND